MKKSLLLLFLFGLFLAAFVFAHSHVSARITGFTVAMPNQQCPEYNSESMRMQCESFGGVFSEATDESGCRRSSCTNSNQENLQEQTCPFLEVEEIKRTCEEGGKKFSLETIGGCEYPICSSASYECPRGTILEEQKMACENAKMESYFIYDSNKCPAVECRSSDGFSNMPGFAEKNMEKSMMGGFPMKFQQMQCPPEAMFNSMETACTAKGGKFFIKEFSGCKFPNCEFGSQMPSSSQSLFFSPCSEINKEEVADKCRAIGLPVKIKVDMGCGIPVCGEPEELQCPQILKEEMEMCSSQGMEPVPFVLPNGCKAFKCAEKEQFQFECMKEVPSEWAEKCRIEGGEIYSKADDNGCIINAQCTAKEAIEFAEINPEDFSVAEALEIALKLEDVEIEFGGAAGKCSSLEKYYQSKNNEDKARIFNKCSVIFGSAGAQIQDIRELLKQEPLTKEALTEAKTKVKELKNVLKQVLHLLLNQDKPFEDIKIFKEGSCGSDMSCFESCLKSCSKCTFTIPEGGVEVEIHGPEDKKCLMSAEATTEDAKEMFGEFMKCRLTNFAAGFSGKNFDECTGPMVEKMREMQQGGFSQ